MQSLNRTLVIICLFFFASAHADKFLWLNGYYSPQTYFGPNPGGSTLQIHEPMWVEYKGEWVYPSIEPDPELRWLSSMIASTYNGNTEATDSGGNGNCKYVYESLDPDYHNNNGMMAPYLIYASFYKECSGETVSGGGRVYGPATFQSCPDGMKPEEGVVPISCVPKCDCSQNINAVTGDCDPLPYNTKEDFLEEILITHDAPNHEDDMSPLPSGKMVNYCFEKLPEIEAPKTCLSSETNNETNFGNPINCATGQKVQIETDYIGNGLDPLTYTRNYTTNINEALEPAWTVAYSAPSISKRDFPDGAILYTFRDGGVSIVSKSDEKNPTSLLQTQRHFFIPANGTSYKTSPYHDPISMPVAGGEVHYNGQIYRFNENDDSASVSPESEPSVQRYRYQYTTIGNTQLLSRVSNRFGRTLDFSYNAEGQLERLVDQSGFEILYSYDENGNLVRVTYPDSTPEDDSDNPFKEYLYEYTEFPNHLTGIVSEQGSRFATFSYDAEGRGISTEHNNGAERVEVSYPADGEALVKFYRDTSTNSYREERFTFGRFRGKYKLTSKAITKCNDCELTIETWEYNSNELLVRHTSPTGIITQWTYDEKARRISKTRSVGTADQQTTTFTWNETHNQIASITTATEITSFTFDSNGNRTETTITPVQ